MPDAAAVEVESQAKLEREAGQPSTRRGKLAIALFLLTSYVIGYITSDVIRYLSGIPPEYHSSAVIRDITEFVRQNEAWPP